MKDRKGIWRATIFMTSLTTLINSINQCNMNNRIDELERLGKLTIKENNTIGKEEKKYYEINGKRAYLEIDGKPIEQYQSDNYNSRMSEKE